MPENATLYIATNVSISNMHKITFSQFVDPWIQIFESLFWLLTRLEISSQISLLTYDLMF